MRLYQYLQLSSQDQDILKFRAVNIGLTTEKTDYNDIVERIQKQFKLEEDAIGLIDEINKELKKFYSGKYRFDFTIDEEVNVDKIKIKDKKRVELLKQKVFQLNDALNTIKEKVETKIQ